MQNKARNQISDYLLGLPPDLGSVGFITDGTKGCFVMRKGEKNYPEHFDKLSSSQLDRFIQYAIRLNLNQCLILLT